MDENEIRERGIAAQNAQKYAWANWDELIIDVLHIREIIFTNGGMANKSAVEDVLMNRHPVLIRIEARSITNYVESHNMDRAGHRPDLESWRDAFEGVEIQWMGESPYEERIPAHWVPQIEEMMAGFEELRDELAAKIARNEETSAGNPAELANGSE
jgi:hypothetical protein